MVGGFFFFFSRFFAGGGGSVVGLLRWLAWVSDRATGVGHGAGYWLAFWHCVDLGFWGFFVITCFCVEVCKFNFH